MNKYPIAAFVAMICSACGDRALFEHFFVDLQQPSNPSGGPVDLSKSNDGPDLSSLSPPPFSWKEDFKAFLPKPNDNGANKNKSNVAYWSFNNNMTKNLQWNLITSPDTHDEGNLIVLDFASTGPGLEIERPPLAAYAIFHPLPMYSVSQLLLCIKYYVYLDNLPRTLIPVDLKVSLLGSDLEVLRSSKKINLSSVYPSGVNPLPQEKFSFENINKTIYGLQIEYVPNEQGKSLAAHHLRITEISLNEDKMICD